MNLNKKMLAILPCTLVAAAASAQSVDSERAYQSELMADANSRTSLLQGAGGSAGYQDGFVISDATGDFTLKTNVLSQFRYSIDVRKNDSAPGADDKNTHGFQIPRAWVNWSGNVINKNIGYALRLETDGLAGGANGAFGVSDIYGTYKMDDNWTARWGQFRPALSREGAVDDQYLQMADRSIVDSQYGVSGRTQGIDFNYTDDQFRFWAGFNDGYGAAGTDIASSGEADYAFQGRFEWMFQGDDWGRFDDFTSFQNSDNAAMAGAAFWWQTGGSSNGTLDVDAWILVLDFTWEGDGWNAFAQYAGANIDVAGAGGSTYDQTILLQGGFFFTENVEAFGNWTTIMPDNAAAPADKNFNVLTLGANYYFIPGSHAAKATADLVYYLDKTTATGIVATPNTIQPLFGSADDGEFALRLQMQMFF